MVLYKDYKLDLDTVLEKQEILKRIRRDDVYQKLLNISLKALTNDYFDILNIKSISKERFYIIVHQFLENLDMYEILERTGYNFNIWYVNNHNCKKVINNNKDYFKIVSLIFYILDYYNANNYFPVNLNKPINLDFIYKEV